MYMNPITIKSLSTTQPNRMQSVTVVTPVFNNGERIIPMLESIHWADQIIIVDMFSTDDTTAICRRYTNVKLFHRKDYIYGNVNFAMNQATSDWVIRLDSDEVLTAQLQTSIRRFLSDPPGDVAGCYFASLQYMFGRAMRYGPGLNGPPRRCMFRRGSARYRVLSEHEDFECMATGRWILLDGYYEHYTNATIRECVTKYIYYAEKDAERIEPANLQLDHPLFVVLRGLRLFWMFYWEKQGYREGRFGFYTSFFRGAIQYWITQAVLWSRSLQ
jgi:glycosyltransferase involved in cell wall biosynthesis